MLLKGKAKKSVGKDASAEKKTVKETVKQDVKDIKKDAGAMKEAAVGDEIKVTVSDAGFALDGPAWASKNGHTLVSMEPSGPGYVAVFRKGSVSPVPSGVGAVSSGNKLSMVVFSGDLDKLIAAFINLRWRHSHDTFRNTIEALICK